MGVRLRVRSSWTQGAESPEARYEFDQSRVVIGRRAGADVQLPHVAVSSTHATLRIDGPRVALVDEGSTNGTRVNGALIAAARPKPLREGDVVEIGGFTIEVTLGATAAPTTIEDTRALAMHLLRAALDPDAGRLAPPRLTVLNGPRAGESLELPPAPSSVLLGRAESCDLSLPDADASREHASVVRDHRGVRVRDLGSKNGVAVNGRATREASLSDRDELRIGATLLVFEDPASPALEAVVAEPETPVEAPAPAPPPPEPGPPLEPEPAPEIPAALPSPEELGASVQTPLASAQPPAPRASADLVVYVLAGAVLALSAAGLLWLLGAG
ncbi:MAG: FHA domain-containing protein [Myxococcales bacterium]|nr:FHA domain-containing protein [Myxococcales bacterium]